MSTSDGTLHYLVEGDQSSCDMVIVFQSRPFLVHQAVLVRNSEFVQHWVRFPGSGPSSPDSKSSKSSSPSAIDILSRLDLNLPRLDIDINWAFIPFVTGRQLITPDDFHNYLCMAYGVWQPQSEALLALKIVPIADFMQSQHLLEQCDLAAAQAPISWSTRFCYQAYDFAQRWRLRHVAGSICAWIDANVAPDEVQAMLLSSTVEQILSMLPALHKFDPVVQVYVLVRYAARQPLGYDMGGSLRIEGDRMVDVLCRGFRGLSEYWTRASTTMEVFRLTQAMTFDNDAAALRVFKCVLEIVDGQVRAGPLSYKDD